MNGVIVDGKVYEAISNGSCSTCAFDEEQKLCRNFREACHTLGCAFKFSQELTDKLTL